MVNWEENTMFVLVCFCGWASISKTRAHNTYTIPPPSYNMYREKKRTEKEILETRKPKSELLSIFRFPSVKMKRINSSDFKIIKIIKRLTLLYKSFRGNRNGCSGGDDWGRRRNSVLLASPFCFKTFQY